MDGFHPTEFRYVVDPAESAFGSSPIVPPGWRGSRRAVSAHLVHELFERRAVDRGDAVAVTDGSVRLSYRELNELANRYARVLVSQGVGPEHLVAVMLPRSVQLVISLLAVLKAGAAYVPIDVEYPAARIALMLQDAAPALLLRTGEQHVSLSAVPSLDIDGAEFTSAVDMARGDNLSDLDRRCPVDPGNVAHVIYTSGSTGRPKGVAMSHSCLVNRLEWYAETFPAEGDDEWTCARSSVSFVDGSTELWGSLAAGVAVVIADGAEYRDPARLRSLIAKYRATRITLVPSLMSELVTGDDVGLLDSSRQWVCGGETLPDQLAERVRKQLPSLTLMNSYGCTECGGDSLVAQYSGGTVALGSLIWNTQALVLDSTLRPVQPGETGEMYIAGRGLARGYHGQPALTAERFVANPFGEAGERMYRMGDRVRWLGGDRFEFLGRVDDQVKLRGVRIDLGEVDAALATYPGIARAAAACRNGPSGHPVLVGYVVGVDGRAIDHSLLREHVADRLPQSMVPSMFVTMESLPLTPNGKLDRSALPVPERVTGKGGPPRSPREEALCGLFAEVLGVDGVGVDDGFFELGGHSLLAVRLLNRARAKLGVDIPIQHLFTSSTVGELASIMTSDEHARPVLRQRSRPARIPLSFAQRELWFLHRAADSGAAYHTPLVWQLTDRVDEGALRAAIADVVARHELLRTVFPVTNGDPEQRLLPVDEIGDLLSVSVVEPDQVAGAVRQVVSRRFDLSVDIPLRAALIRAGEAETVFVVVLHHIAEDGWSENNLSRDLSTAYTARLGRTSPIWADLPVQYADYTLWHRDLLGSEDDPASRISRQLSYWRETLADLPPELPLPFDRPRTAVAGSAGGSVPVSVDSDLHRALECLAEGSGASLFMVVQAAFAVLLSRCGAGHDIAMGTAVAGRGDEMLDELVGYFVNALVLRSDLSGRPTFRELLSRVKEADAAAFENQDVPFGRVVEALNPPRSQSLHPLFQVMFTFNQEPTTDLDLAGVHAVARPYQSEDVKFDLALELTVRGDQRGMTGTIEYRADLFDDSTATGIADRLVHVLNTLVADPDAVVDQIDIVGDEEQRRLLFAWNDTDSPVLAPPVPVQFERQVAATPHATALVVGRDRLTYRELNARANRLARVLLQHGAGPERFVAILLPPSVDAVVAVLAVLKTGGAYLPIDPGYPPARVAYMLDAVQPIAVLSAAETTRTTVPPMEHVPTIDPAGAYPDVPASDLRGEELPARLVLRNAAFVIFTSGSTGRPKGVVVEHASLTAYLAWCHEVYTSLAGEALVHSPLAFDLTVTGLLGALTAGGTVRLVDLDDSSPRTLGIDRPTFVKATPSHLQLLLAQPANISPSEQLVLGGESLLGDVLNEWRDRHPGVTVINEYGPTETTVGCTWHRIEPGTEVPPGVVTIGRPVSNARALVLGPSLRLVPVGVVGELYMAGDLVTRGYHGQPALTAERFVANPYGAPGERMYRTGDLVRWNSTGTLEFVGRVDGQVKIRGFRIETGEIERALTAVPGVAHAVVVVREDRPGDQRLVAYYTAAFPGIDPKAALADALPSYMIPAAFVEIDAMPLTRNGKLDTSALPVPDFAGSGGTGPRNAREEVLCRLFGEVLGSSDVGIDDGFFDLGGHSLLAIQLVSRIRSVLGVDVPIRDLFNKPTVAGLASVLAGRETARPPLRRAVRPARIPVSFAQQRLWFLARFEEASAAYHVPLVWHLSGVVDPDALSLALRDVVARHECLRTVLPNVDGEPEQRILDVDEIGPVLASSHIGRDALDTTIQEVSTRRFNLDADIPIRAELLITGADEATLVVVLHHIAADGWSMGPFLQDLSNAYNERLRGSAPSWQPLPVQYADYSIWQREVLGSHDDPGSLHSTQISYWRNALRGIPPMIGLPTDRPRPAVASYAGATVEFTIPPELYAAISGLANSQGCTLFMVLHATFAVVLTLSGAGEDVPLGTLVAGRTDQLLDDVVGFFVNTLVLRTDTSGDPTFRALLERVRKVDLDAYSNQDVPFERLVEALNPERSMACHPLFQVLIALDDGFSGDSLRLADTVAEFQPETINTAKFDLSLDFERLPGSGDQPEHLRMVFEYSTDLLDRSTVVAMGERLIRMMRAVTADPDLPISRIDFLSGAERMQQLTEWQGPRRAEEPLDIPSLVRGIAGRRPDAVAVSDARGDCTYGELCDRAAKVTSLLATAGAGADSLVSILSDRSPWFVSAVVGVLDTGAGYLPVDAGTPVPRVARMLADSGARYLVVPPELHRHADTIAAMCTHEVVVIRPDLPPGRPTGRSPARSGNQDLLAYAVFTSGSTGGAKGVLIPRRGLANHLNAVIELYGLDERDVLAFNVPLTFDVSIWQTLTMLAVGGRVHTMDDDTARDPVAMLASCAASHITILQVVPALLRAILEALDADRSRIRQLGTLRLMLVHGEELPRDLVARWYETVPNVPLYNVYGPAECSDDVSIALLSPSPTEQAGRVSIGKPLVNTQTLVLDARLRLLPVGAIGELYVAGPGLARGYAARPGLTAERFVANPFGAPGERMYRTGDLVRWNTQGELEFVERADRQIKIRGFRVEPAEVEQVLGAVPGVATAVVIVREDRRDDPRLVAYYVPDGSTSVDAEALRAAARRVLPSYLIPSAYVGIDAVPLTPNGKVDQRALPVPEFGGHRARAPRTAREKLLCELYAEVLGASEVGIDDSFFELGGHSLLATRLLSRIGATLGVRASVRDLFDNPTVSGLSTALSAVDTSSRPALLRRTREGELL